MTTTYSFFANPSTPQETVNCRSGNNYVADNSGIIHGVAPQDCIDLLQAGCKLIDSHIRPEWVAGRFYGVPNGASLTTLLTVLGTMYAYPIYVPNLMQLKSLSISSTTGQTGGKVRAGLYTNYDGMPNALISGSDSGDLAATSTAVATFTAAAGVYLPPGIVWLATQATASSTMPTVEAVNAVNSEIAANIGYDTAAHALAGSAQYASGVAVTGQTYGAMPATFPTGGAPTINAATPAIALGV